MELLGTVRTIVKVLQENYAPLVAGNLAYSAFASIRPLLTLASVASTSLSILPHAWLLEPLPLIVPLAIAFLPVFYVFPDANVTVREVLSGVVLTALGWAALQGGFQLYASQAAQYQVYGVLGAVLLVLTWLYVAALVLLVGAALNVVLADRTAAALSEASVKARISTGE